MALSSSRHGPPAGMPFINQLPDETLGDIFLLAASETFLSLARAASENAYRVPPRIVAVCRRWREVALAHPLLWGNIPEQPELRQIFLARSRDVPISLTSLSVNRSSTMEYGVRRVSLTMDLACTHRLRLRSLKVDLHSHSTYPVLRLFEGSVLPCLRTLKCKVTWQGIQHCEALDLSNAPHLCDVYLSGPILPTNSQCTTFTALRSLHIGCNRIEDIFPFCPALEELTLESVWHAPRRSTPTHLPHLRKVALRSCDEGPITFVLDNLIPHPDVSLDLFESLSVRFPKAIPSIWVDSAGALEVALVTHEVCWQDSTTGTCRIEIRSPHRVFVASGRTIPEPPDRSRAEAFYSYYLSLLALPRVTTLRIVDEWRTVNGDLAPLKFSPGSAILGCLSDEGRQRFLPGLRRLEVTGARVSTRSLENLIRRRHDGVQAMEYVSLVRTPVQVLDCVRLRALYPGLVIAINDSLKVDESAPSRITAPPTFTENALATIRNLASRWT